MGGRRGRQVHGGDGRAIRLRRGQGRGDAALRRQARHRHGGFVRLFGLGQRPADAAVGRQRRGGESRCGSARDRAPGGLAGDALREARPEARDRRRDRPGCGRRRGRCHGLEAAPQWAAERRLGIPAPLTVLCPFPVGMSASLLACVKLAVVKCPAGGRPVRGQARDWSVVPKKRTGDEGSRQGNGGQPDPDLKRLAAVTTDQEAGASDQSASDADQTASDVDQTMSDTEGVLSARDQVASDRDQRASDRDQAVSDLELDTNPGAEARATHDANLAERAMGSRERKEAGQTRATAVEERASQAKRRDETAWHRDVTAQARDSASDRRDRESAKIERKMGSRGTALRTALVHAAEVRAHAAKDRARAAEDRAQAATDRERAADERDAALAELRRAHLDELTGAYRRGTGEVALQNEIDRALRQRDDLVIAFVDVDGLRDVNNRQGHSAGDELLRDVVAAIRAQIRSYEPIVRFGGDEFVCAVGGVNLNQAGKRFAAIQDDLAERGDAAVSVGLAEMRKGDTLAELIERADAALLDVRRGRSS